MRGTGIISFALTERDEDFLAEARTQAQLAAKYGRDFERDEEKLLPHNYPEAEDRPETRAMLHDHVEKMGGARILNALLYLEDWRGGVSLRECRYSFGKTVLDIAGTRKQQARWNDKTIAIAQTEPIGGSDPASTRATATWDAANREMDFAWARLHEAGVTPDCDARPTALTAAADQMLTLDAEWEATYLAVVRAK